MFVIIMSFIGPAEEVDKLIPAHRAWRDRQYLAGRFHCSGPQLPRVGGVILAYDIDRNDLNEVLAEDPYAQAGLTSCEILEFEANCWDKRFASIIETAT